MLLVVACGGNDNNPGNAPQCSDGIDNDGDGKIDFPDEPGCTSLADDSETDNCPNGAGCPQCSDGVDNDGDGDTDFGQDLSVPGGKINFYESADIKPRFRFSFCG